MQPGQKRRVSGFCLQSDEGTAPLGISRTIPPSSGAELVSGWIPNRMYLGLSITMLFNFMATSSRTLLIIFLRIFSTSTTAARLLFMNWSTNCLSRGSRLMNHSTVFSRLHSSPRPVESRHLMSAPAQAVHHPICLGMITAKTNSNDRSPKAGG